MGNSAAAYNGHSLKQLKSLVKNSKIADIQCPEKNNLIEAWQNNPAKMSQLALSTKYAEKIISSLQAYIFFDNYEQNTKTLLKNAPSIGSYLLRNPITREKLVVQLQALENNPQQINLAKLLLKHDQYFVLNLAKYAGHIKTKLIRNILKELNIEKNRKGFEKYREWRQKNNRTAIHFRTIAYLLLGFTTFKWFGIFFPAPNSKVTKKNKEFKINNPTKNIYPDADDELKTKDFNMIPTLSELASSALKSYTAKLEDKVRQLESKLEGKVHQLSENTPKGDTNNDQLTPRGKKKLGDFFNTLLSPDRPPELNTLIAEALQEDKGKPMKQPKKLIVDPFDDDDSAPPPPPFKSLPGAGIGTDSDEDKPREALRVGKNKGKEKYVSGDDGNLDDSDEDKKIWIDESGHNATQEATDTHKKHESDTRSDDNSKRKPAIDRVSIHLKSEIKTCTDLIKRLTTVCKYKYIQEIKKFESEITSQSNENIEEYQEYYNKTLNWMNNHHYYENIPLPCFKPRYYEATKMKIHLCKYFATKHYERVTKVNAENDQVHSQTLESQLQETLQKLYKYTNAIRKTTNSSGMKIIHKLLKDSTNTKSPPNSDEICFKEPLFLFNMIQDEAIQRTNFRFEFHRKWHVRKFGKCRFFTLKKGRDDNIDELYNQIAKTNLFATTQINSSSFNTLRQLNKYLEDNPPPSTDERLQMEPIPD